jgi:hypothetical protein
MQTTPCKCPHCGYLVNAATDIQAETEPQPGDYSLCLNCGAGLVFTSTMEVREPRIFELKIFERTDPDTYKEFRRAQQLIYDRLHFVDLSVVSFRPSVSHSAGTSPAGLRRFRLRHPAGGARCHGWNTWPSITYRGKTPRK